ncbi:MAG: hypothetical protein ACXADH_06735 [Candidatus Kariarchaeaceae archaeon]
MTQPIPGYAGKVAHVNLNSNIVKIEETPWNVVANVIGGKGLVNQKLLHWILRIYSSLQLVLHKE